MIRHGKSLTCTITHITYLACEFVRILHSSVLGMGHLVMHMQHKNFSNKHTYLNLHASIAVLYMCECVNDWLIRVVTILLIFHIYHSKLITATFTI